jgi:hypothetical protein
MGGVIYISKILLDKINNITELELSKERKFKTFANNKESTTAVDGWYVVKKILKIIQNCILIQYNH